MLWLNETKFNGTRKDNFSSASRHLINLRTLSPQCNMVPCGFFNRRHWETGDKGKDGSCSIEKDSWPKPVSFCLWFDTEREVLVAAKHWPWAYC